jgi:hypothetical protein
MHSLLEKKLRKSSSLTLELFQIADVTLKLLITSQKIVPRSV